MNPVLAEVFRKDIVESCHRGSVIAVDSKGKVVLEIGDTDRNIYPRSSLKLFQAIPLLESGAAKKFYLTDAEIALTCASHNAETFHVEAVNQLLNRLDLEVDDLECGPAFPMLEEEKHRMLGEGKQPTRAHHKCSGKHMGMLAQSKYFGVDTAGYSSHGHPSQQAWMQTLSEIIDLNVSALNWERDGCGIPAICMPMERLAFGCALLADTTKLSTNRADAVCRILSAIKTHPEMVAGSDRCCTAVIEGSNGSVIVKTGAEAVYVGVIPELKTGIAIKIDDGSSRGSEVALGATLKKLGAMDLELHKQLSNFFEPTIYNSQQKVTGYVRASNIWN